jgi:hypothetical protein
MMASVLYGGSSTEKKHCTPQTEHEQRVITIANATLTV